MSYKCAFCDKEEYMPKWFVIPVAKFKPNQYSVCKEHEHLSLDYYDVYPNNQDCPITKHDPNKLTINKDKVDKE